MTESMNNDDLLTVLAQSLTDHQPPADAIEAAYAAHGRRTLEADLARLLDDSQVEVVLFRDDAYSRQLTYSADQGSIEIAVDNDRFEVVVTPGPVSIVLHRPDGQAQLNVDRAGRISGEGVTGPVRFEVTWADGSTLTPWITL